MSIRIEDVKVRFQKCLSETYTAVPEELRACLPKKGDFVKLPKAISLKKALNFFEPLGFYQFALVCSPDSSNKGLIRQSLNANNDS